MVKRTKSIRERRALWGGIAGLVLGFWMIFITKTNLGFIPAFLGIVLLIWGRKNDK
jgi:4-amino-4-deoxy-L-arabinose transferase-like glycosyltransferase